MLVSASTGGFRPVITDFGLALNVLRPDNEFDEPPGQGTPAYMAPGQRNSGKVTSAADQYALGIVMCEMLTGSRPLPGSITDQSTASFTSTHRLPPRWKRVILRCVEIQPENRFRSVDDIIPALEPPARRRKTWVLIPIAALGLLTLAIWHPSRGHLQPTSLAVLPLRNESGNPNLDYVAVGISEALTEDLSRMSGLSVTAGSVARRFGVGGGPAFCGSQNAGRICLSVVLSPAREEFFAYLLS